MLRIIRRRMMILVVLILITISILIYSTNQKQKYFSSQLECQKKTDSQCRCEVTTVDSEDSSPHCIGWYPMIMIK
ncbi:hypothetical protein KBA63_05435 [Candidatus Woesebacteria bacterium]|nr:hypothetical protein [Candidatus Woesebacteria bacterium]MBP9687524.1 hypothetical protein [Candidatus Woesebacteria bacterium]